MTSNATINLNGFAAETMMAAEAMMANDCGRGNYRGKAKQIASIICGSQRLPL